MSVISLAGSLFLFRHVQRNAGAIAHLRWPGVLYYDHYFKSYNGYIFKNVFKYLYGAKVLESWPKWDSKPLPCVLTVLSLYMDKLWDMLNGPQN